MAALVLRPQAASIRVRETGWTRPFQVFGERLQRAASTGSATRYGRLTGGRCGAAALMLVVYAVLLALTVWRFVATPDRLHPGAGPGLFHRRRAAAARLVAGADRRAGEAGGQRSRWTTQGVMHAAAFAGLDGTTFTNAPNAGTIFLPLTPFDERGKEHIKAQTVLDDLRAKPGPDPRRQRPGDPAAAACAASAPAAAGS